MKKLQKMIADSRKAQIHQPRRPDSLDTFLGNVEYILDQPATRAILLGPCFELGGQRQVATRFRLEGGRADAGEADLATKHQTGTQNHHRQNGAQTDPKNPVDLINNCLHETSIFLYNYSTQNRKQQLDELPRSLTLFCHLSQLPHQQRLQLRGP